MDIINFKKQKKNIMRDLMQSDKNIPNDNNEALYNYYKSLIYSRHNFLHYCVLEMIGKEWEEEKQMRFVFDDIPEKWARKTPDIVLMLGNDLLICDVSLTYDIAKTEKIKTEKYKEMCDWIKEHKELNVDFVLISVLTDNSNLLDQVTKLDRYAVKQFDSTWYFSALSVIEDKKEILSTKIDKEFFYFRKNSDYGNVNENDEKFMCFKDELKYVNIGQFNDIDIDEEYFDSYNKNFVIEENIEKNKEKYNFKNTCSFFKKILEDKNDPINKKYRDNRLDSNQFEYANEKIKQKNDDFVLRTPAPTIHIVCPFYEDLQYDDTNKRNEQVLLLDFFKKINSFLVSNKDQYMNYDKFFFLKDITTDILYAMNDSIDKEVNMKLFCSKDENENTLRNYRILKNKLEYYYSYKRKKTISTSILTKNNLTFPKDNKKEVLNQYNLYEEELLKTPWALNQNLSFRDYLIGVGNLLDEKSDVMILDNKRFSVTMNKYSMKSHFAYEKTGIKYDLSKRRDKLNDKKTINYVMDNCVDNFLNIMLEDVGRDVKYNIDDYLKNEYEHIDSPESLLLKNKMKESYELYYDNLRKSQAFWFSRNMHNLSNELMHFTRRKGKTNTFYVLNGGLKNYAIIVCNTHVDNNYDGQPFMCVWLTNKPERYDELYGKIYKVKYDENTYLCCTNWRKLSLIKLTHLRDSFYMTLSSTMNSALSSAKAIIYTLKNRLRKIFSIRILISNSTSQKIAELLMDNRYAFMSAFSTHTNINKLLLEKFGPPYSNVFELWIVKRLLKRLPLIHDSSKSGGINITDFKMDLNMRDINYIGGDLKIPSLWHDHLITDVTELLDEIFIYVHTLKEPSNIFHENIKAIKTIKKFQEMFDKLDKNHQMGIINTTDEIRNFLEMDTQIGCSSGLIIDSVQHTLGMEKPFFKKIIHEINDESIGEILSTKAVIKENDRKVVRTDMSKREKQKYIERISKYKESNNEEVDSEMFKKYVLISESTFYGKYKPRQKVTETIMEELETRPELDTTVKYANHFSMIRKNRNKNSSDENDFSDDYEILNFD